MAKKRKSENTGLDEIDKSMYATFCSAANSLSQLYTQAQSQQKLAFQVGERHSMEKMYQWMVREHESGSRLSMQDVFNYIQKELDCGGDEVSMSTSIQSQNQSTSQHPTHYSVFQSQNYSGVTSQGLMTQGPRLGISDQNKNTVFSNALSSPIRRSLQNCQAGAYCPPNNASQSGSGTRRVGPITDQDQGHFNGGHDVINQVSGQPNSLHCVGLNCSTYGPHSLQMRDSNLYEESSAMDMNADGPAQGFYHQ